MREQIEIMLFEKVKAVEEIGHFFYSFNRFFFKN